jgi:TRAP-type mannitol/chloroaromatic compound transport system substrate-binding protein
MQRRDFIKAAGAAAVVAGASTQVHAKDKPEYSWKMVTTWPKNFPGLGTGANHVAELIGKMSAGRIQVKVYGAGELVPAFEVFDAVSAGTAEMGHGAAYYWKGKSEAAQFFTTVPFGLTAQEMNGWLYYGGGMELWTELYAKFNLVPAAAGNTGVQMGGWFNREINSLEDLKGIKMRIPGLGGEVLKRAGGTPVNLPGGEIFTSLQSGAIDATEWIGPYNDLAFGLYKAAKYYYYPGWHEPGTMLEGMIHKPTFEKLPEDLQTIVMTACKAVNLDMLSEYMARNPGALSSLIEEHGVEVRHFPPDVIAKLRELSNQVVSEIAETDEFSKRVYASYQKFLKQSQRWSKISEYAYLSARDHA